MSDPPNIDDLKRSLLAKGLCIECCDKSVGLVAEYAMSAYTLGYDRGYDRGVTKRSQNGDPDDHP